MEEVIHYLKHIWKALTGAFMLDKYDLNFANITQAQPVTSSFAEVTFSNLGTSVATVNNFPIQPGEQLVINGNKRELDVTQYFINFIGPPTDTNSLWMIRKVYRGLE